MKRICLILTLLTTIPFNKVNTSCSQPIKSKSFEYYENKHKENLFKTEVDRIRETIKHIESRGNYHIKGGSGEHGAYQIMPKTWRGWSKKYFGRVVEMTEVHQDYIVSKKISEWLEKGYSPAQMASMWNSGSPKWDGKIGVNAWGQKYNVPKYVNNFMNKYNSCQI